MANDAKSALATLLATLIEKGYTFFIFTGTAFLLPVPLNGTKVGPISITVAEEGERILIPVGLIFLALGIFQYFRQPTTSNGQKNIDGDLRKSTTKEHLKKIDKQKEEISSLKYTIKEIIEIARQDNNSTSRQILEAISILDVAVQEHGNSAGNSLIISQWVEARIPEWISEIKKTNFRSANKNETLEVFKEDTKHLLLLLCNNLKTGIDATPKSENIKLRITYLISYKNTLLDIKNKIAAELSEQEMPELNETMQRELIGCLSELVESIQTSNF
ncbi:MAG: hypothetical protein AAF171_06655 [Cyanobacteria bacterium P01_A01_bin.116]